MRFVKKSARARPALSLVLLDWSVRESFHLLDYLRRQRVPRDAFEVIVIEYYDRESPALAPFADMVDTWLLLQMPRDCLYHKHLMYNAGIVLAHGDLIMIGDSDAMVRETFIGAIIDAFAHKPRQVLHLDQFRNHRRDFYPFNWPSFDAVLGEGCVNNSGGKTTGLVDQRDPLHTRNYGACMCAPRAELIAVGGADEHIDFLGHICGPYDMTFRLLNRGVPEIWHDHEFTYHTWHPGQAGEDNYQGPHDGRQMSITALEALVSGRILPLVENAAIATLRRGEVLDEEALLAKLIDPRGPREWRESEAIRAAQSPRWAQAKREAECFVYKGYRVTRSEQIWRALPILRSNDSELAIASANVTELLAVIDTRVPLHVRALSAIGKAYVLADRLWERFVVDRRTARTQP